MFIKNQIAVVENYMKNIKFLISGVHIMLRNESFLKTYAYRQMICFSVSVCGHVFMSLPTSCLALFA